MADYILNSESERGWGYGEELQRILLGLARDFVYTLLDNNIALLKFLILVTLLWLCKRILLFLGNNTLSVQGKVTGIADTTACLPQNHPSPTSLL